MRILIIRIFLKIFIILCFIEIARADQQIGDIYIVRKNVFDSTNSDWFFAAPLANSLHVVTKEYYVNDEVLFHEGDILDSALLNETERNLRATGLFTRVKIELDSVNEYKTNVYVITRDRWSTNPSILFGTGGNSQALGGRMEELNLAGTGTYLSLEALYRTEDGIGWQGNAEISQRRLFESEYSIDASILSHRFRTEQYLTLMKPFRTLETVNSYGIFAQNSFGDDFLFDGNGLRQAMPFHQRMLSGWYSHAWKREDRVFFTVYGEYNDVDRGMPSYRQAFDNTGKLLIAFSSVSQNFIETNKLNTYLTEDLTLGGYGTATLGKTFSLSHGGENVFYLAAQGEKSYMKDNIYFFGQVTGASAFSNSQGYDTYEEFFGLGFLRLNDIFLLAGRVRQQTVWNWSGLRQLILDNYSGLRGYAVNSLHGDNRFLTNFECRMFPNIGFWIFKVSAAAFYDGGTVWDQKTKLQQTVWHNAAGFGLRFHNMIATGTNSIFRIDFAYNFDEKRLGEIIFTTDQLFSVFQSHNYKLPQMYGLDFDYE